MRKQFWLTTGRDEITIGDAEFSAEFMKLTLFEIDFTAGRQLFSSFLEKKANTTIQNKRRIKVANIKNISKIACCMKSIISIIAKEKCYNFFET